MLESAFVVLREVMELLLVALAIHAYLGRIGRKELLSYLWGAIPVGAAAGVALVAILTTRSSGSSVEGVLSIALGLAVLCMAIAMLSSREAIDNHIHGLMQDRLDGAAGAAVVAGLAGFTAFRETVEMGIFLRSIALGHGVIDAALGAAMGLVLAGAVALAYRSLHSRIPLLAIFRLSTLLLCLLSIQLTLDGLGKLLLQSPQIAGAEEVLAALLTPEGSGYAYLCAALMVVPLVLVVRHWWRETSSRPARDLPFRT